VCEAARAAAASQRRRGVCVFVIIEPLLLERVRRGEGVLGELLISPLLCLPSFSSSLLPPSLLLLAQFRHVCCAMLSLRRCRELLSDDAIFALCLMLALTEHACSAMPRYSRIAAYRAAPLFAATLRFFFFFFRLRVRAIILSHVPRSCAC